MGNTYGYVILAPTMAGTITIAEWSTIGAPRLRVQKYWRMMCIPEWWVVSEKSMHNGFYDEFSVPAKLAGPFETEQAAEAALLTMREEN